MRAKYLWIVTFILTFFGCEDSTNNLGLNLLPNSDNINVYTKTFDVLTESTLSGPVYAQTSTGYVGRFTDKLEGFGYYEGSFLTELNCIDDLTFPKPYDPVNNRNKLNMAGNLDEAFVKAYLTLYYDDFFGDSLNPCRLSIYELDKKLEINHKTNVDPTKYMGKLLAQKTYTAANLSDSLKGRYVDFTLDNEFGKNIIKQNWANPENFHNSQTFIDKVFKGIYIKNDVGDGTVLYAKQVILNIMFRSVYTDSLGNAIRKSNNSADSTYLSYRTFASTREVIQANQIIISNEVAEKAKEEGHTYLKAPAGIFTKATLPIKEIMNSLELDNDTINAVKLAFQGYYQDTLKVFSMRAPSYALLIREKEIDNFFEKNQLPDNITSYVVAYSKKNKYEFNNLARLVTTCINELQTEKAAAEKAGNVWDEEKWIKENKWNTVALIPVDVTSPSSTITNVQHDLKPQFVKLRGGNPANGGEALDLQVTYSRFNKK